MTLISKIDADLTRRTVTRHINAVQCDSNTRAVAVTMTADGAAWTPPAGTSVSLAFRNLSTGHKGRYDKLPDGSAACSVAGNVVTAVLAPAVLAAPGEVQAAIVFQDAGLNQLATFSFRILVEANPAAGQTVVNDYYYVSTLTQINDALEYLYEKATVIAAGAPTNSTEGAVGCLYMDTETGEMYKCTAVTNGAYVWENVLEDVNAKIGEYFDFTFIDGYYVSYNNNGVYQHNDFAYAEVELKDAAMIEFPNLTGRANFGLVQFRNGSNFVAGIKSTTASGIVSLKVPDGSTTALINCTIANKSKFFVRTDVYSTVNKITSGLVAKQIDLPGVVWENGKYLSESGRLWDNENYSVTDFVPVFPFPTITAYMGHNSGSAVFCCCYDENKNFIKSYMQENDYKTMKTVDTVGIHYVRFCCSTNELNNFNAYGFIDGGIFEQMSPGILAMINADKPEDRPYPVSNMPENGGYMAIFDKIGVVGDSLSSGEMSYGTSTGTTRYVDMYPYSWIQCIARMCGSTALNFSKGGLSTDTFIANAYGLLDKLRDPENKCKCYFIALGHNDNNKGLPIGTFADIDLTDYNNNANSYYGNYAGIVQRIREVEPDSIIFPITMKSNLYEDEGWNTAIRHMADIFDNVYILDMHEYYHDVPDWHYTEGHGNIMGYLWYAKEIACYVDWIVRNNTDKFKYVQFIGTEYAQHIQ